MIATFGEYLKAIRKEHRLTLTQMGAKLEIDSGALSKIENGKRQFDEKKLDILANGFHLDLLLLKNEYFSEKIAYELILNECSEEVLPLAEKKVKYIRAKNNEQLIMQFTNDV